MDKKLKIAQLLLPWLTVPPKGYGGTEMVVHYITEELVKRGHEVTLFSVGDSVTDAKLEYLFREHLGLQRDVRKTLASNMRPLMHVANCFEKQEEFDIIHSHAQFLGLPFSAVAKTPTVHTFHREYRNLSEDENDLVNHYKDQNFISISNSQRIDGLNFVGTAYNGIDSEIFSFSPSNGQDYLMWAGRLMDKKGPKEAIEVAKKLDMQLVMVGEKTEPEYFKEVIEPELASDKIKLIEHVNMTEMAKLYRGARIVLAPVKWNEPFGLVATESMSSGTPVVAFGEGGLSETVEDSKTGFVVGWKNPNTEGVIQATGIDGLVDASKKILDMTNDEYTILREQSRKRVEEKFIIQKMVDSYEEIYRKVINGQY